jgi:guanylate kinase
MKQNMGLKPVVPYTTRPMREGETEGTEYHFISDEDFFSLKAQGKLIEYRKYTTMHGIWRYMTVNDGQIDLEKGSYLMIGTLESYEKTRACFGGAAMVPIYLTLDDGERMMRALKRERQQKNPKYAELCRRFLADEADFAPDRLRECGIEKTFANDDFTQCTEEITDYIREQLGL